MKTRSSDQKTASSSIRKEEGPVIASGSMDEQISEVASLSSTERIVPRQRRGYAFFKRAFDIFFSLLDLLLLLPLFLFLSLLIVMTSRGPAIYVSTRIGRNGRPFRFYKFRSMYKNADQILDRYLAENELGPGVTFKMKNDPRITRLGKFLRLTSLDELPQLFNILKGDMSFVGPRPCTDREYALYDDYLKQRQLVPQGLTGEWQVNGRSLTTFREMIEHDFAYIERKRGYFHDIRILLKTVGVVIIGRGAE